MTETQQSPLLIVWNDSYHTGINILDEQHRGIVSIINSLHFSRFLSNGASFLQPSTDMVMGYTKIHFATEIKLLEESAYPRLQEQKLQHANLIAETERILKACLQGDGDPGLLLDFLKQWWVVHITGEDKAYSTHLKEYFQSGRRVIIKREG